MNIQRNGDSVTLFTDERIDANSAPRFAAEMEKALVGATDLTLDFGALTYISSSGLRAVMLAVRTMEGRGGVRIVNVGKYVYEVLEATGFVGVCDVEPKA